MIRNILLSLLFTVIIPSIANLISNKFFEGKVKFDAAYLKKITILFSLSFVLLTLLDYLWKE